MKIKTVLSSLLLLYIIGFVFTLRSALPSYVSSTFLSNIIGQNFIGFIYILISIITLIIFVFMPKILKKYGNYKLTIYLAWLNFFTLLGLSFFHNPFALISCFIITYISTTIMGLCIDIFIEHDSSNSDTGKIRSLYLTSYNLAWLVSPWLSSLIIDNSSYWKIFLIAATIMLPVILLISYSLKNFKDPEYIVFNFVKTIKEALVKKDIKCILIMNFLLQFFYALMVVYTPIYLHDFVGFDWSTIGIIFTIMLLPFVFIQIPLGRIADKYLGEQEILIAGFIIMAISTFLIPLINGKDFWLWAIILFVTRIGAAAVEVMSDTYFFKKIGEKDVNLISLYRTTSPLAYIVSSIFVLIFMRFFPLGYIFFVLGVVLLIGVKYGLMIKDTK